MPCVHYKFRSKLTHETLLFAGLTINVGELKSQILKRERLKFCELQISNAQANEEYSDDEALIPNNASVIVRRIPAVRQKCRRFVSHGTEPSCGSSRMVGLSSVLSLDQLLKTENLAEANASEEDKIKAVMYQSSLYSSSDAMKLIGLLPPHYICFRCGIPGHHIKHCPTKKDEGPSPHRRIRTSAGIPRSFLVEVDDPKRKGVMMDRDGRYVIPIVNVEAYTSGKKQKPQLCPQSEPPSSSSSMPSSAYSSSSSSSSSARNRSRSSSPVDRHTDQKRTRH